MAEQANLGPEVRQCTDALDALGNTWDDAQEFIELSHLGGPGSPAHEAAVVGDVVGNPLKDTAGPSINIPLKVMAIVSIVFGPIFALGGGASQGGRCKVAKVHPSG